MENFTVGLSQGFPEHWEGFEIIFVIGRPY